VATYLFLVLPIHGHLNPTFPVAGELIQRGHQVTYWVPNEFRSAAAATGAAVRTYASGPITSVGAATSVGASTALGAIAAMFLEDTAPVLEQVIPAVRAGVPDVVVHDSLCLWSILAARIIDRPAAAIRPTYAANAQSTMLSGAALDLPPERRTQMLGMFARVNANLAETSTRYGVPPLQITDLQSYAAALNIVFVAPDFQPSADTFDERYLFVGPSIPPHQPAGEFPFDQLDASRRLVYISLGTIFNNQPEFFKTCFEAFADSPYQVVISSGSHIEPDALGARPPNVLVASYAPQLEILARASAFITHAGMNSTMEALYYGVPMVAIPQMVEQAMTARRIAELGLGLLLEPATVTAAALRAGVADVLADAALRARVAAMQTRTRAAGGYRRAADALIAFAQQSRS
jgi:MGT family glycosyltransferase